MQISDQRLEEIWRQIDRKADDAAEDRKPAHEALFRDAAAALREFQQLRIPMAALTPDERLQRVRKLLQGYCKHCGMEDPQGSCQCWNDD